MPKSAGAELGNFSLLLVYYLAAARFHACSYQRYANSNDTGYRTTRHAQRVQFIVKPCAEFVVPNLGIFAALCHSPSIILRK